MAAVAMRALVLREPLRESYAIMAAHFRRTFQAAGIAAEEAVLPLNATERRRVADLARGRVVFHTTIGPLFEPIAGVLNVAVPFHEWSRYPQPWVARLNTFDAVWVTTRFGARVMRASGVVVPVALVQPALTLERPAIKGTWAATRPFRFLSCGSAHFRKGFHLLIEGFLRAFPRSGAATLTIKTGPGCRWASPRSDITIVTGHWSRRRWLDAYSDYDAYVSTSLGEGFGMPIAEAVLAGVPVVAHRWGGHADLLDGDSCWPIRHRVILQPYTSDPSYFASGQQCAYSDPEQVAAALQLVVASTARARRDRARLARERLVRRFGPEAAGARVRRAWPAASS